MGCPVVEAGFSVNAQQTIKSPRGESRHVLPDSPFSPRHRISIYGIKCGMKILRQGKKKVADFT
jgi:hypothetical protein